MNRAYLDIMTNEAKKHDAKYADFAARMLAALATEEASIAKYNSKFSVTTASMSLETVRPSKG